MDPHARAHVDRSPLFGPDLERGRGPPTLRGRASSAAGGGGGRFARGPGRGEVLSLGPIHARTESPGFRV